jgi:two-component system, sensor histidine kinase and response regulator
MGTPSTLLCIHRDPTQLRVLQENGYELATATNGWDGLRLLMSRPVDAVVLEHHLSDVDGTAIADEIKRARPEVPIVMLVDHLELSASALKSVDALVAKADGAHFLWATVHFVLNVKPTQHREARLRAQKPDAQRGRVISRRASHREPASSGRQGKTGKDALLSPEIWQGISDGKINL